MLYFFPLGGRITHIKNALLQIHTQPFLEYMLQVVGPAVNISRRCDRKQHSLILTMKLIRFKLFWTFTIIFTRPNINILIYHIDITYSDSPNYNSRKHLRQPEYKYCQIDVLNKQIWRADFNTDNRIRRKQLPRKN